MSALALTKPNILRRRVEGKYATKVPSPIGAAQRGSTKPRLQKRRVQRQRALLDIAETAKHNPLVPPPPPRSFPMLFAEVHSDEFKLLTDTWRDQVSTFAVFMDLFPLSAGAGMLQNKHLYAAKGKSFSKRKPSRRPVPIYTNRFKPLPFTPPSAEPCATSIATVKLVAYVVGDSIASGHRVPIAKFNNEQPGTLEFHLEAYEVMGTGKVKASAAAAKVDSVEQKTRTALKENIRPGNDADKTASVPGTQAGDAKPTRRIFRRTNASAHIVFGAGA